MSNRPVPSELTFEDIKRLIPQRFPFLMIDRAIIVEPGQRIIGIKNLTGNEWFFQGHFPNRAVTPGAMICEAVAQTGIVFFRTLRQELGEVTYLLGSIKMRFIEPVLPGDQMHIEVTPVKLLVSTAILSGVVKVSERIVAKGEFALAARGI